GPAASPAAPGRVRARGPCRWRRAAGRRSPASSAPLRAAAGSGSRSGRRPHRTRDTRWRPAPPAAALGPRNSAADARGPRSAAPVPRSATPLQLDLHTGMNLDDSPIQPWESTMNHDVTVLGLGLMGRALAGAFLRDGHPTTVWNRTVEKAGDLVGQGARLAASPGEAVAAAPLTVICVSDHDAVLGLLDRLGGDLGGRV